MNLTRIAAAAALGLAAALPSLPAAADANTAKHNLIVNMKRAQLETSQWTGAILTPIIVKHMYVMKNAQGQFMGLTNEAGTFIGGAGGYQVVEGAGKTRPMTPAELAALRREVMENIDYDKLIKVQHGDGGGRRLLVFSAIDCPHCGTFERDTTTLNTTYYIMPGSLQEIDQGGLAKMQTVARLWCAQDNSAAWKAYWAKKAVPPARSCAIDAKSAEDSYTLLRETLYTVGTKVNGTPAIVREDGVIVGRPVDLTAWPSRFGREGAAGIAPAPAPVWLGEAAMLADAAPAPAQGQPGKINTKDLLMKLFK